MSPDTPQSSDAAPSGVKHNDQDILDDLLGAAEKSEDIYFESPKGDIKITLKPITDRKERYEYLSKLPSGWFEAGKKDDPEEVDDMASLIPDGDGIGALEDILIQSAQSPALTELDIKDLVTKRMSDDVLTELALKVIQLSSDATEDQITGFRQAQ